MHADDSVPVDRCGRGRSRASIERGDYLRRLFVGSSDAATAAATTATGAALVGAAGVAVDLTVTGAAVMAGDALEDAAVAGAGKLREP